MLHIVLFVLYFLILCFIINRLRFTAHAGIERKWLNGLFILKVAAGAAVGWISANYYGEGNDYWTLNKYGIEETHLLKLDPREFFFSLFRTHYDNYDGFFTSVGSFWNDLKNNIIIKFLAVCNLASGGNYYINSLFFSFISFFGHIALFRIFFSLKPQRKWIIVAGAFLIPSTLYFSSGIHKDSIIFTALAVFSWLLFKLTEKRNRNRRIICLFICATVILFIRSHVFIAIVPAAIAYILALKKHVGRAFTKVYVVAFMLLIIFSFIPSLNPVAIMAGKQADFFALPQASSQLPTDTLHSTTISLIKNTPQAFVHGFVEPMPWKYPGDPLMLLGLEAFLILALILYWLFKNDTTGAHPITWFCIAVAIPLIMFAGYIVPNAGSIVRYRAIYLPWLLIPLLISLRKPHIRN